MEKRNEILIELRELGSGLAAVEPAVPYRVPVGYFDEFPLLTLQMCRAVTINTVAEPGRDEELAQLSPLLSKAPKAMPFSVPAGYFADMPGTRTTSLEQDQLPAIFKDVSKTGPYGVPLGYFENLPAKLANAVQTPGAKVIKGSFRKNIVKYAAAAVITGVALVSGFFIFENTTTSQPLVSDTRLKEKASQTSDEEIINYLKNVNLPASADSTLAAGKVEIQDDAIFELLADVTDEELQQYLLAQTGSKILIN